MPRNAEFDVRSADIPRDLFPQGRIRFSLGVPQEGGRKQSEADRRRAHMMDLRKWGAWDVLRAIEDGVLHVADVSRRLKQGGEASLSEIRRDLEAARVGEIPTFAAESERYLEWYARRRGPRTLAHVRSRLKRLAAAELRPGELFGAARMDRVTREMVETAVEAMSAAGGTRELYRQTVSGLYTWSLAEEQERARARGRLPRWSTNPARLVEAYQRSKRVTTASEKQALSLLAAAEPYQEAYVRAFLHLGLRAEELTHTRLHEDLDVETWTWRIQARGPDDRCECLQCRDTGWSPKGWPRSRQSERTFIVPEIRAKPRSKELLRSALLRYLELYPAEPGDFVFRNPRTGGIWPALTLRKDFAALCERAEVRYGRGTPGGITIHTLRHTCATNLVRAGVRESVIAALLGDTVQTIVSTYVHLTETDLAEGARRGPAYLVG